MAKQLKLSAQTRLTSGRNAVNQIKKQGLVPAVIYGGKEQAMNLSVSAREIGTLLSHATSEHLLIDLEIGEGGAKTTRLALIQQVQRHPIKGAVLHVDFHAVNANEVIHAGVPVETSGEAAGVKNFGGILEIAMHSLEVECLPRELPEVITIDVSALGVGDAVHVKDIQLPAGVTTRADGDLTVVRVAAPKVEVEPEPAAAAVAAAQPEVIKEKKEEPGAAKPAAEKGDKK